MEVLKGILNIANILCDEQQKRGCEICPAQDSCNILLFKEAESELNGGDINEYSIKQRRINR